jgi:type I restriction enzyme M protein
LTKGPRSVGSIAHARKQGLDPEALEEELAALRETIAPTQERIAAIEGLLAPYRALKAQIAEARRKLRALSGELLKRLVEAVAALGEDGRRELVLDMARDDLTDQVGRYVAAHRQRILQVVERLWEKYHVSLRELEEERRLSLSRVDAMWKELGYVEP